MANYVWTPFDDFNVGALTLPGKINRIANLGQMNDNDVLYLSAHHNKFLPYISDGTNKMEVYEVCDKLVASGLKRTHQCLKLWLCYAGFGMQQRQGFAYQFWHTMHNIYGFHALTVFAYTELTCDPIYDKHKTCYAPVTGGNLNNLLQLPGTAKEYRVGVRANGEFIPLGQS